MIFHGWVDEPGIDAPAARARAVVFPPVWHEPAGLAPLNAWARGRAVIATRSGGVPEYLRDGVTRIPVGTDDAAGLAAAFRRLADDPELARRLGEAGHTLASGPFAPGRHVVELDRIYREFAR